MYSMYIIKNTKSLVSSHRFLPITVRITRNEAQHTIPRLETPRSAACLSVGETSRL